MHEYLAIQKNRTSLFPLVDKTQGPTITWPEDEPVDALKALKVASTPACAAHGQPAPGRLRARGALAQPDTACWRACGGGGLLPVQRRRHAADESRREGHHPQDQQYERG